MAAKCEYTQDSCAGASLQRWRLADSKYKDRKKLIKGLPAPPELEQVSQPIWHRYSSSCLQECFEELVLYRVVEWKSSPRDSAR